MDNNSRDTPEKAFLITVVIPTYNVARYLPEFLDSLDAQTVDLTTVELIFVNDGSTDDSREIIDAWADDKGRHVIVINQENQGLSAARNAGLRQARGEWVSFPDPDDTLDARYFEEVEKFIRLHGHPHVNLVAAHQMRFTDGEAITNTHPGRKKFEQGSRVVDILIEPIFQLGVNASFTRVRTIRELGLEFDVRVRPTFEDAHFNGRYLLLSGKHHLGIMASAKYNYRRRADGTSLVQSGHKSHDKYVGLLRHGELDLLKTAAALGPIPRWTEHTVLYDLVWYFRNERDTNSPSASAPPEVFDEFHQLAAEITGMISREAIFSFDIIWVEYAIRLVLSEGYKPEPIRPEHAILSTVDETHQLVKFTYWFNGDAPSEQIIVDGDEVVPVYGSIQNYDFYGRTLLRRRHLWVRRGQNTSLIVDGRRLGIARSEQKGLSDTVTPRILAPHIVAQRRVLRDPLDVETPRLTHLRRLVEKRRAAMAKSLSPQKIEDAAVAWSARSKKSREKFARAWVFMDRDTEANDNAEHVYRYVAKHHPEINSWFVLRRTSHDWARLEAEGFRLVDYGSAEWRNMFLHAEQFASSQIDWYVVEPLPKRYGKPRFHFTFLQHGITNYDISRWLNTKKIDVFVTATPDEYQAIAGDGPYSFTDREVMLTGFPRHDSLLERRSKLTEQQRDLIVVMPTWRTFLVGPSVKGSNERQKRPMFETSDYAIALQALLSSERLRQTAERTGKTIAFMPHPNMRPYLNDFDLPSYVTLLNFAGDNVQDVLARAAAFVTDYSSLGFDAAFLDVPMAYFQFDADVFFGGSHIGRRGQFEYARDGFGPVATTADDVVTALVDIADRGYVSDAEYLERTARAFVTRDGRSCERVYEAMRSLTGGPRPALPEAARGQLGDAGRHEASSAAV